MTDKITLDPNRPYGEVHGGSEFKFEQDGLPFNPDPAGALPVLAEHLLTEAQRGIIERRKRVETAKREAEKLMAAALGDGAIATISLPGDDNTPQKIDIDLDAWFRAEKKYRFDEIAEACRKKWNVKPKDTTQARRLITSNGAADLTALAGTE